MKSFLGIVFLSLCWCALLLGLGILIGWVTISVSDFRLMNSASFVYRHLRLSVIPFACLLFLYGYFLIRIRCYLKHEEAKLSDLTYYDRLLNTTISSFFGVGVIWTAVGMESALMQALDGIKQGHQAVVSLGAWGLLERLVNGGLLLALSTTVFGGVCGYFLRLLKIVLLGKGWDRFVLQEN